MGQWISDGVSIDTVKKQAIQIWICGDCGKKLILRKSPFDLDFYYCPACGKKKNKESVRKGGAI